MKKSNVIYVKKEDDLASIVEKVILSKEKEVILVVPKEANLSRHRINFQILKREAEYAEKEIFVDTDSEVVKDFCKDLEIHLVDDYSSLLGEEVEKRAFLTDILPPKEREKEREEEEKEELSLEKEAEDFWQTLEKKHLEKETVFSSEDKIVRSGKPLLTRQCQVSHVCHKCRHFQ